MNCTSALPADAALDTLLLPFATGALIWPSTADVLFMRARAGAALGSIATDRLVCQQSFRPFADALLEVGLTVTEPDERKFPLILLLPPRQREESRALLARALQCVEPGGTVVASALNNEGARSAEGDLERLAGSVRSLSKNKCRVFWATATAQAMNTDLITEWATLDAPQRIADGRFLSRPGLFSWMRIDRASALLAGCLPTDMTGCGADLGAGFGYLAAEVVARCPGVSALDLYEAEARGLEPLDPPQGFILMLNKPVGYTCSTKDLGQLIYELLPPRFRLRSPLLSAVGRLDRDTSGLLLMTDDGALLHRITSPKAHLPKVYEARLADALRGDEAALFARGTLLLESETVPLAPAILESIDSHRVRITTIEGRYHQVRRMFAAVGNHVETLQRVAIGGLTLGDLEPGEWRVLGEEEIVRLFAEARPLNALAQG